MSKFRVQEVSGMFTVHLTRTGRYALVNGQGVTEHVCDSQLAAQTLADFKNRANYEPTVSPYYIAEGACEVPASRGRWATRQQWKEQAV